MIAIEGRFNISQNNPTQIISATTNAKNSNGSSDLSGIINTFVGNTFISTITSNDNGYFKDRVKKISKYASMAAKKPTWQLYPIVEVVNGVDCYTLFVAYEIELNGYLSPIDKATIISIDCKVREGSFANARTNLNMEENTIGVSSTVYIPTSLLTQNPDLSPDDFVPEITVDAILTRYEKTSGTAVEIEIITDYATNVLEFKFPSTSGYPPKALVNGVSYDVGSQMADDAQSVAYHYIEVPASMIHKVVFEQWSEPNSNFQLSGIMAMFQYKPEISRRSIVSFNRDIFDRDNAEKLSYGVISCGGSLKFNDFDGTYRALAERLALNSDIRFEAFLVNTLSKKRQNIAYMKCANWNYDNNNRSVSVTLKDDLEEWQDIQVEGFDYDPRNPSKVLENKSMADLYKWLHGKTPIRYFMLSFADLDEATQNILTNTTIEYPLLESGNLWAQWNKLCVACCLHIYKNSRGDTVCAYTDGV